MPDDETLLVETFGDESGLTDAGKPPYAIRKYFLSEISDDGRIGPEHGSFILQAQDSHIVPSSDGRLAHIINNFGSGTIYTIDVGTMRQIDTAIELPRNNGFGPELEYAGSITKDGRYMIVQRDDDDAPLVSSISVADLIDRTSWTLPINPISCNTLFGVNCGENAINHGQNNSGLLAIRGGQDVGVFEFIPHGPLRKLSRWPLGPVDNDFVYPPIAWSGDGSYLFVGAESKGRAAVLVLRVSDGGKDLSPVRWINGCEDLDGENAAYSIFTNNRKLARVPTLTPLPSTPSPTAPATAMPTASATGLPSVTPSPSHTPASTATAGPTSQPGPIYLPVSLRESCTPEREPVDVVLAVDTSTSMEERTASGIRKLDGATAAARMFLGLLQLGAGDRVAIIAFNAQARLEQPLTADRAVLTAALARLTTAPQTCLPCAVDAGATELEAGRRSGAMSVLVLLTDGRSNPRPVSEAVDRASVAKTAGVTIFTIALGGDVDAAALQAIASFPAAHLAVTDAAALESAYSTIARTLPCPPDAFWGRR